MAADRQVWPWMWNGSKAVDQTTKEEKRNLVISGVIKIEEENTCKIKAVSQQCQDNWQPGRQS